jgi:hypothetical protein
MSAVLIEAGQTFPHSGFRTTVSASSVLAHSQTHPGQASVLLPTKYERRTVFNRTARQLVPRHLHHLLDAPYIRAYLKECAKSYTLKVTARACESTHASVFFRFFLCAHKRTHTHTHTHTHTNTYTHAFFSHPFQLLMLGPPGSGKTTIVNACTGRPLDQRPAASTRGIQVTTLRGHETHGDLQFWDYPGGLGGGKTVIQRMRFFSCLIHTYTHVYIYI